MIAEKTSREGIGEEFATNHDRLVRMPQKDHDKVGRRIGRVTGEYPAAARLITAKVRHDTEGLSCGLDCWSDVLAAQKANQHKGAYLLRTNCHETDPAVIWKL